MTPFLELIETGTGNLILPLTAIFVFVVFINIHKAYFSDSVVNVTDKKHSWCQITKERESYRCTLCEVLIVTVQGVYCDSCGVCADVNCILKVARMYKCKEISTEGPMKHRWIKGNLPEGSICDVCNVECAEDMRCIWCHRTLHFQCEQFLGEICDFGLLRQVVLPPCNVVVRKRRSRMVGRGAVLVSLTDPNILNWSPLFVIGNPASGSRVGETILSGFRFYLNPLQVFELGDKALKTLAYILSLLPESSTPNILVAGGDGSVSSLLSSLYQSRSTIKCAFRVGIVPLGTGNDLARVLGWGKEEPRPFSPMNLINKILDATPIQMDRWEVKIPRRRQLGLERDPGSRFMYNYLSIGVDARVTLDFHKARNSNLYLGGRLINKALYLVFGTQQVVDPKCTGLENDLKVELDGIDVRLPELESVVLLNIPSWGAGCNLWQLKENDEEISQQSISDGKLEVAGIYSSFHMAQLQVGLSTPYRIGQASSVRIEIKRKLPMQIDGEPWIQHPGVIIVNHASQVCLLHSRQ